MDAIEEGNKKKNSKTITKIISYEFLTTILTFELYKAVNCLKSGLNLLDKHNFIGSDNL